MPEKDEQLSPEEKLLRVIQGGGKKPEPNATPDAASSAESSAVATGGATAAPVVAAAPRAPAEEPKLRVARAEPETAPRQPAKSPAAAPKRIPEVPEPAPAAATAGAGAAAGAAVPAVAAAPTVMAPRKRAAPRTDFNISAVNIVLAVFVLIVLLCTGREMWANVRDAAQPVGVEAVALPEPGQAGEDDVLPALDSLLDAVEERGLFARGSGPNPPPPPPPITKPPKEFCRFLGITWTEDEALTEAIIMDQRIPKMIILKVGDSVVADDDVWTVSEIRSDGVVFKNGPLESVVQ